MDKKYIIAIVIAVLAFGGAFWFGKRSAIAPEGQERVEEMAMTTAPTTTSVKVPSKATAPKTTTPSAPAMTKDGAYIVSYTERGFVPATLEIKKGKSVHFVNNSNKAMSLTTTDPNSQVFIELNQERSVGRGGSYDFTFLSLGSWGYMNRNNTVDKGVVMVK